MIKSKITLFQDFDGGIGQIYILQDIIKDIYDKILSHLNEIISYAAKYIINNQEKFQTIIIKSVIDNDNERKELPISNLTSIKSLIYN